MALTTQEVIDSGEYLDPRFDPKTLKKDILLGILVHHNIQYPSSHKKDTLIALFNDEIKPRAPELKRARSRARKQEASSEGVMDGITGRNVPGVPAKRQSRASSKTPVEVPAPRRKSATPVTSTRASGRRTVKEEELEDSEVEEEEAELPPPAQKPRRRTPLSSATTAAKPRSTRKHASPVPEVEEDEGNTSAWDTNNPFQSGPSDRESTSPKRLAVKKATKTKIRAVNRPSKSASPEPETPAVRRGQPQRSSLAYGSDTVPRSVQDWKLQGEEVRQMEQTEPEDEEEEELLPPQIQAGDELVPLNDTPDYRRRFKRVSSPGAFPADDEDDVPEHSSDDETGAQLTNTLISKKLADLSPPKALRRRSRTEAQPGSTGWFPSWTTFVGILALLCASTTLYAYKADSAYIGYCDAGSTTNLRIKELQHARQLRREAASACIAQFNTTGGSSSELCSPIPIHSPFEANQCTPCPKRAICTPDSVICQTSFILKPHFMSTVPLVSAMLNGMPKFGSVAFPPTCVEDREKLKKIGGLVNGLEGWLARRRGEQLCKNVAIPSEADGGEAKALGFEFEALRLAAVKKHKDSEHADEIFEKALAELDKYGLVYKSTDTEGFVYVAATRADFNLSCRIRVYARNMWAANRLRFFGFLTVFLGLLYGRQRLRTRSLENKRVAGLVQEALDMIQEQEMAHHIDNVATPDPFVVPAQLRDTILMEEHSPAVRQRVWMNVERIVEGNTNVRTNEEQVHGEDMKVWRWVGTSTPAKSRRVSFANKTASGSQLNDQ